MTSKSKSIKNLILIAIMFVLTIIIGTLGLSVANADTASSRIDYIDKIQTSYDQLKDSVEPYNGVEVLDGVKASADYLIGYEGDVGVYYIGSVKDNAIAEKIYYEKMAQMSAIANLVEKATALKDYVNSLNQEEYNKVPWDDIERIEEDFLIQMDILKLFSDGNLNNEFVDQKYNEAIDAINGIDTKPAEEDLTAFKEEQKGLMVREYEIFVASNYYNGQTTTEQGDKLTEAKNQIDRQTTKSGILSIKSGYLSQLRNSLTLVEECYNDYVNAQINGGEFSISDIANAINLYSVIENGSYELSSGRRAPVEVAHSRLLSIYRAEKLAEAKDIYYKETNGEKLINRYSKYNSDEISQIFEDTRIELASLLTIEEIDREIEEAKSLTAEVETNKQTIYSEESAYTVTITATDNEYAFAPTAYVQVEDYEFYAVKKNVNRLLKKIDAGEGLKYEVKYYIDFTIIDENGRVLDEEEQNYEVQIEIDQEIAQTLGEDFKVIYYFNGVMDGYSNQDGEVTFEDKYQARIETIEGGQVLKFTTTHFSPYALCGTTAANGAGLGDQPIYCNPFLYVAIILLAIIVCIIVLIVLKHWKYKVVFKNNGGTRVKTRKFKKTEPIEMPSAPTKPGFIFGGWYANKKLTKRFVWYRMNERKSIKLWAKWIPINEEVAAIEDYYQALRAALDDYERVGVQIGLKEEESIARIIISNNKVLLYVCGEVEKYQEMGYEVYKSKDESNADIPVKFIINNEEDLYQGLEIIDIAMKSKGFTDKPGDPEVKEISEEERKEGFIFTFKNEKVADTLKEWFEMLRLQAKSFVMVGDSGTPRDLNGKFIVKAKRYADRIDLYLPVGNENSESVAGDPLYKDVPNKFVIKTAEDVPGALNAIEEAMISLGMKKYPRNASQLKTSGDSDTAFGYRIRFN